MTAEAHMVENKTTYQMVSGYFIHDEGKRGTVQTREKLWANFCVNVNMKNEYAKGENSIRRIKNDKTNSYIVR